MPKRAFPFNNCTPLQLKTHVENKHVVNNNENAMEAVYAKTQSLLKAGAKTVSSSLKENNNNCATNAANVKLVCQNCKRQGNCTEMMTCSFCDKIACSYCTNICFNCEQNFCVLCSIVSYENPEETSYCLTCCG